MDSNENNYKGGVEDVSFDMNTSDENLLLTIEKWINESKPYHDLMLKDQNQGIRYHHGDQTDKADIPEYNSNTVYNRIWEATETIIPIITGSAHQFIAVPGEENELSLKKAQSLQKVLIKKYEDLEIQKKLENVSRDIILKKFGVIKWDWNYLTDDVDARVVDPRLIFIPKLIKIKYLVTIVKLEYESGFYIFITCYNVS